MFFVDDTICGGSGLSFSTALATLRRRFPFRKWQIGDGTFCGSKYVQNKITKEIMISQTEFAAKTVKIPMSAARKKMREDLADEAGIRAFRGVSGSVSWLAGQTRPDVPCQVSQLQQNSSTANSCKSFCASSMVVRRVHQHSDLGLKIRRVPVQHMILLLHVDASLNTGGLVGSQGGYICGVTAQSLLGGKSAPWSPLAWRSLKMSRTVPSSLGAEAQAMSVVLGFVEWATLFLQELIHGSFDLRGAPAVMRERPPVCVTDCKCLYDHLLAVGSPTTLQDKRSAVDVLITIPVKINSPVLAEGMRFSSMSAGMPSRILWISSSTFATYSLACEACCSILLNFSFCSMLVMMRHAARRQPAVLPYTTDSKFRSSTESSKGCSPTLCRDSVISMTAIERRCSATMLAEL